MSTTKKLMACIALAAGLLYVNKSLEAMDNPFVFSFPNFNDVQLATQAAEQLIEAERLSDELITIAFGWLNNNQQRRYCIEKVAPHYIWKHRERDDSDDVKRLLNHCNWPLPQDTIFSCIVMLAHTNQKLTQNLMPLLIEKAESLDGNFWKAIILNIIECKESLYFVSVAYAYYQERISPEKENPVEQGAGEALHEIKLVARDIIKQPYPPDNIPILIEHYRLMKKFSADFQKCATLAKRKTRGRTWGCSCLWPCRPLNKG